MKHLKVAIRFFEKYSYEKADKLLFDLFLEWKESTNPSIQIERAVYLSVCDVRGFLNEIWLATQKGEGLDLILRLGRKPDFEMMRLMKGKKRILKFINELNLFCQVT